MLLNIGFGVTIVAALLLLVIAFARLVVRRQPRARGLGQRPDDHEGRVQPPARDQQLPDRLRAAAHPDAAHRGPDPGRRRAGAPGGARPAQPAGLSIALEQLIDGRIMEQLAPQQGVTVTDADVDARLAEEATTPELRHAWMIAVEPTTPEGETEPDGPAIAEAKAAAAQALADLKAGKSFEEVAKGVSTDASKEQGGDLGFIDDNAALDAPFVEALFAAAEDTPTGGGRGRRRRSSASARCPRSSRRPSTRRSRPRSRARASSSRTSAPPSAAT